MTTTFPRGLLVRIIHPPVPVDRTEQRRVWLTLGEPATVGEDATLTAFQDSGDSEPDPYLVLATTRSSVRMRVDGTAYDCKGKIGMHLVPLAVEFKPGNRCAARVMVQFLRADETVRWAS